MSVYIQNFLKMKRFDFDIETKIGEKMANLFFITAYSMPISFLVMWALGRPQQEMVGVLPPQCTGLSSLLDPPHRGPSAQASVPEERRGCAPSSVGLQSP